MSLLSTRQKDSEELRNKQADDTVINQCPLSRHEYCDDSGRGQPRKVVIRLKQHASNNRKANKISMHDNGFEHKYDRTTMREESIQIADYASAEYRHKNRKDRRNRKSH